MRTDRESQVKRTRRIVTRYRGGTVTMHTGRTMTGYRGGREAALRPERAHGPALWFIF